MAKPKYTQFVTPTGIAKYTYLAKPQDPYQGKGDPQFKVRILLDDTAENRAWIDKVVETGVAEAKKNGVKLKKVFQNPFKYPEDQDEDDFLPEEGKDHPKLDEDHKGRIFVEFKSKFKPGLIDSARATLPEDVKIYGGDTIRVKFELNPYEMQGSGLSLRLKVVQLIAKNTSYSGGGVNTDGFDDVEGGYVSEPGDDDEESGNEQF